MQRAPTTLRATLLALTASLGCHRTSTPLARSATPHESSADPASRVAADAAPPLAAPDAIAAAPPDSASPAPSAVAPQLERTEPAPTRSVHPDVHFAERTTAGARATDTLPLIVALHGLGDTPEAFVTLFDGFPSRARIAAARGPDRYAAGFGWLPMPVPRDLNRRAPAMHRAAAALEPAVAALARARPTCGLPLVVGFSQGAMIAYALAASPHPVIAAAFPISGYLPRALVPHAAPAGAPMVSALHGRVDRVAPFSAGRDAIEALRRAGYRVAMHAYPGVGHALTDVMRRDLFLALAEHLAHTPCPP